MSLNQDYFDSIQIELIKKKYYDANKVDAILAELRHEAVSLQQENARLQEEYARLSAQKAEISEAVMSAQLLGSEIVQKANRQAEERKEEAESLAQRLLADAQAQAQELIASAQQQAQALLCQAEQDLANVQERIHSETERAEQLQQQAQQQRNQRQEYAVKNVETCISALRSQYQAGLEMLNQQWQDFLCGLFEEESATQEQETDRQPTQPQEELVPPQDLGEKLQALADDLESLEQV